MLPKYGQLSFYENDMTLNVSIYIGLQIPCDGVSVAPGTNEAYCYAVFHASSQTFHPNSKSQQRYASESQEVDAGDARILEEKRTRRKGRT